MLTRLQKYLADCGYASRRRAEEIISAGRVKVNGEVVNVQGVKIDPEKDEITVDNIKISNNSNKIYILMNKPRGVTSTCAQEETATILDLIKGVEGRLFPVGRLDRDSEGLLLITNDGEVALKLTHPRYEHEKEYDVVVDRPLSPAEVDKLKRGIYLEGKKTLPAGVMVIDPRRIKMILKEGRNRQIRKMMEALGNEVVALRRVRLGKLTLGELRPGEWRYLTDQEISALLP
ncbi:MAG: rRNA pseudouridine synthase [Candidatus Margulisbacteria bacterium]|nr:rRNA pseudouridine synthase [Candidatus Margulisiibacteriota bacterium]MBU1617662.1 rRNA pseudouridine synthase [Candidatus Margulisiibacteriota bacterium]MBU1867382.1 rRNA pseudouridine synthase [Candidatus Margulisiibacteriota bacterium]